MGQEQQYPFDEKPSHVPTCSDRVLALTWAHGPLRSARCCEPSSSVPLAWAGDEGALSPLHSCCALGFLRLQVGAPVHTSNHSPQSPELVQDMGYIIPRPHQFPAGMWGYCTLTTFLRLHHVSQAEHEFTRLHEQLSLPLIFSTAHSQ